MKIGATALTLEEAVNIIERKETAMPTGFIPALAKYFGRKEGQTLSQFQQEIQQLTYKDKLELHGMLEAATGEQIVPPASSVPPA